MLLSNKWLRRSVTISVLLIVTALYFFSFPVLIAGTVIADLTNRNRFALTRALAFFAIYLLAEIVGVVIALVLTILAFNRPIFLKANYWLQDRWATALYRSAAFCFGLKEDIQISPDLQKHISGRPVVLLIRHVSTADTVFGALFFAKPFARHLRYVLKAELAFDPCLDIVGHRLPNSFVVRGKNMTAKATAQLSRLAAEMGAEEGILIFPEGTRFTTKKKQQLLRRFKDDQEAVSRIESFHQVLPPKHAGVEAIAKACPDAAWVLMGHRGVDKATTFKEFAQGALLGATIEAQIKPVVIEPDTNLALQIDEIWHQLDDWVVSSD